MCLLNKATPRLGNGAGVSVVGSVIYEQTKVVITRLVGVIIKELVKLE